MLYGMMRQPQGPSKQEIVSNDSKFDPRELNNKSSVDVKSRISSPPQNSSSSATPMSALGGFSQFFQLVNEEKCHFLCFLS